MKRINVILILSCLLLVWASLLQAQQKGQLNGSVTPDAGLTYASSNPAPTVSAALESPAADPADPDPPQGGTASGGNAADDQWHLSVSPYLWFPGVHGTVGAFGHDASFRASPTDLLSHFRFGLMGMVEARHRRILVPIDMMWIRLKADKALPFPPGFAQTANLTATEFILTPKLGLRLIDAEKFKVDALAGIRFWYFGENLHFSPAAPNLNFSKSQNWVDPVVGGRIEMGLSPKTVITIAGDVGGWGTGSQLEYQIAGLLGYKVKPNMTLQAGYRYLYFDYQRRGSAAAFATTATSGVVIGATLNLK